MLRKVEFRDYRCFEESEISFRKTSIIVGQNNAGKSTIVEALRILSTITWKFKQINYVEAPKVLQLPAGTKGVKVNLDHLKIDLRTVVNQYKEEEGKIAIIKAYFDANVIIRIYVLSVLCFATIEKDGRQIKTKSMARDVPDLKLYIMPQIGLIREDEKRLSPETVKEHMQTRLASRHFRNQLLLYKKEFFEEFKSIAQMSWPGLRINDLIYNSEDNKIELLVYDSGFAAEIGLMGSGLQMWLQMVWFISRVPNTATIVLDEPDVYMHPDLQQKIFKIIQYKFQQTIIATHSIEIIALAKANQIVTVDKSSRKMKYADNYQAVQNLVDNLGGVNNLSLIRIGNARKCIFVEGKDIKLLDKFYEILYPDSDKTMVQLPTVELGGWSRFSEALGAARLFYEQTHGEIQTFCILDRDYHSDEEIQKLMTRAEASHLNLHVWEKKELENYIITPRSVFRLTNQPIEMYDDFCKRLFNELDQLKQELLGKILDQVAKNENNKGKNPSSNLGIATKILESKWKTLDMRLSICNGKELVSFINSWLKKQYHCASSRTKLLSVLEAEDICPEMKKIINKLMN